ncbi:Retrovirus-related Pol polyprotein from transposon 17.6 [Senna tora]|uniref:Retrovirus-related Pol polyprotein from transposon 17.6 n=1 Tax=Senna tora TaxID=362788 RepID=A0A834XBF5_9FABA|nr:Retrovirus-related Pol polyprotein from transposon 17.6 [Senna tora]
MSNNQAEYEAMLAGLELAQELGADCNEHPKKLKPNFDQKPHCGLLL